MDRKTLRNLGFVVILLLVGLVYAAVSFKLPWLYNLLLIIFGAASIVSGIQIMIKGVAIEGRQKVSDPRAVPRFTGLSARLIGLALLLIGAIIIYLSSIDISSENGASFWLAMLLDSPSGLSLLYGLGGLFILIFGIVRLGSGSGRAPGYHTKLVEIQIRIWGAIAIVIGCAMLALAAGFLFVPQFLQTMFTQMVGVVKSWLVQFQ